MCVYNSVSLYKDSDHNNQPFVLPDWCHLAQTVDHKDPFAPQVGTKPLGLALSQSLTQTRPYMAKG